MYEHPIESLMTTAMNSIRDMVDVNTIIGEPVEAPGNIMIIPISKVGFGFASGGSEFNGETLNEYIGHFEETKKDIGNVGLAAHNRGYKVNYFQRIKELENGDEIIYTYGNKTKIYKVADKTIIKDSDWTKLENTEENILTLITCLEDEPEYRRCIQAVEK